MTEEDIKNKNLVLIQYLNSLLSGYKVKAEYSTNDNDINVIVVQETSGDKVVFWENDNSLFNYYDINIYGEGIEAQKETSVSLGSLIGKSIYLTYQNQNWQIIFKQLANPRTIQFLDIQRIAYTLTLKCIVNRVN